MQTKSNYSNHGRYSTGGNVVDFGNRLGWWERTIFSRTATDVEIVLTNRYANRPDLVAYDMYGQSTLMWLVLQYNNIIDVATEFVEGAHIILPSKNRVFGELLSGTKTQSLSRT